MQKEAFNIQATLPQGTPLYTFQQLQNYEISLSVPDVALKMSFARLSIRFSSKKLNL